MIKGRECCDVNQESFGKVKLSGACQPSLKENLCNHMKRAQESSQILKNVLDIATTLVKILKICGIHECKSSKALDVIIYVFMHFDEVTDHPGGKSKKRIRKEEFYTDLMRDCGMTKTEAKLTYSIVKCAFKAFYYKQVISRYDPKYVDECEWKNAANKTINALAQSGVSRSEVELAGRKILCTYENYVCRIQAKDCTIQEKMDTCPCSQVKQIESQQPSINVDSCKIPCLPDPLLCGSMRGEIVCPPGYLCPQVICRDPCGRTFLKIDGDKIHFDPLIMECEARRAAMGVCSPTFADCLKTCIPRDKESCDEFDEEEYEEAKEKQNDYEQDKISTENVDERVTASRVGRVIKIGSLRTEHLPKKNSVRSFAGQSARSAAGSSKKASSVFSTKTKDPKDGSEEGGVFVEIVFSNDKTTFGENMLGVKLHGGCKIDKNLINSLDELEVQYNDDPPMSYSCSSKPEILDRIAAGSNINNLSVHSLHLEPVTSDFDISSIFFNSPALQKNLPETEVDELL